MSKLSIDRLQLQIIIDNDQAHKELRALENSMKSLQKEIKKAPEGSAEWTRLTTELKKNKAAHDKIIETLGIEKLTVRELSQRQKELNLILRQIEPGTEQHKKLAEQLKLVNTRQKDLIISSTATKSTFQNLADQANHLQGIFFMAAAGIAAITATIAGFLSGMARFSDAIADIRKTTNLTQEDALTLAQRFKTIDTRSTRAELLELARIAGKLGIEGVDNLYKFVKAADQINVALTSDLGGNTEQAIREIGKLVSVFQIDKVYDIETSLLKVGSVMNALGASTKSTEANMLEFTKSVAGTAVVSGISIDKIFGYAAALESVGQSVEVSATALSGVIVKMFSKPAVFASIAKVSLEDFNRILSVDADAAFRLFLKGLNDSDAGMSSVAQSLQGIGLDGKKTVSVLAALSSNLDLLAITQKTASEEFEKGTDITREFNIKNETFAANLAKTAKILYSLFIPASFIVSLTKVTKGFYEFAKVQQDKSLKSGDNYFKRNEIFIISLIGIILRYNAVLIQNLGIRALDYAMSQKSILIKAREAAMVELMAIRIRLAMAATVQGTIATKAAAVAQQLWNIAMGANPIAWLVTGITALVLAIKLYDSNNAAALQRQLTINNAIYNAKLKQDDLTKSLEEYNKQLKDFNRLSQEQKYELGNEIYWKLKSAEASLKLMEAEAKRIEFANQRTTIWQDASAIVMGWITFADGADLDAKMLKNMEANAADAVSPFLEKINAFKEDIESLKKANESVDEILQAEFQGDQIGTESLTQLEEKLRLYNIALKNAILYSEDYNRILLKIAETRKLLPESDDEEATKKLLKAKEEYYQILKRLSDENIRNNKSALDKELFDIDEKYKAAYVLADEAGKARTELELQHAQARADLLEKFAKEANDKFTKGLDKLQGDNYKNSLSKDEKELTAIVEKYRELYELAKAAGQDASILDDQFASEMAAKRVEIEDKACQDILDLKKAAGIDVSAELLAIELENLWTQYGTKLGFEEEYQLLKQAIIDKFNREQEEKELQENAKKQKLSAKELKIEEDKKNRRLQIVDSFGDAAMNLTDSISKFNQAAMNRELKAAGDNEFKKEEIRKEYAKKQQNMAAIEAAIQGALGIVKTGANLGYPLAIPFQIIQGLQTIAEITVIKSQQFKDGKYDVIGASDRQTYRANYVPAVKSGLYTEPTLIGGLGLVAEKSPELVFDGLRTRAIINTPGLVEALMTIRAPQFASGNYPSSQSSPVIVNQQAAADFSVMQILLKEISEKLDKPTRAAIVYSDLDKSIKEVENIKKSVSK